MGWSKPHGGHSKSPNSSSLTGAVAGPSVCGGWAPGGRAAVVDGAVEEPFEFVVGFVAERVMAKNAPTATTSTRRMMIRGRFRFIESKESLVKVRPPKWLRGSEKYPVRHWSRANPHRHVLDAASNQERSVPGYKCPRYLRASHSD